MLEDGSLERSASFISDRLREANRNVATLPFFSRVEGSTGMRVVNNIETTIVGRDPVRSAEIIVVGAHYDSTKKTPGANDNGSGVAVALELSRRFERKPSRRTIRFVFFVNEEEPYFTAGQPFNEWMGSRQYARLARVRGDHIVVMFSLETLGYYTSDPRGQCLWPATEKEDNKPYHRFGADGNEVRAVDTHQPLVRCKVSARVLGYDYVRGDFVAFVGNFASAEWVQKAVTGFRKVERKFRAEGFVFPGWLPGPNWSDHRSFWEAGYRAVLVTDTAPLRYPYYHSPEDMVDMVDFLRLAKVARGIEGMLRRLDND